jgi:hypothetical protein
MANRIDEVLELREQRYQSGEIDSGAATDTVGKFAGIPVIAQVAKRVFRLFCHGCTSNPIRLESCLHRLCNLWQRVDGKNLRREGH